MPDEIRKIGEEYQRLSKDGFDAAVHSFSEVNKGFHIAKDAYAFWEKLRYQVGLDLRGVLRRRALIPFVLSPRHVSARQNDLSLMYRNLRQAHHAFIYGAPVAALALMRSVMELIVRDYYGAKGADLSELINSVAKSFTNRANAAALHRLRRLANEILHGPSERSAGSTRMERRELEREIVSLLFVLRALVEGAPRRRQGPMS